MMRRLWSCSLALLLGACGMIPSDKPSVPDAAASAGYTPGGVPQIPTVGGGATDQHFAIGSEVSNAWWGLFQSPELNDLVKAAIAGNRNLAAAQASLDAAHEAVAVTAGNVFYPQVNFGAGFQRQRANFQAFGLTNFPGLGSIPPKEFNVYTLGPTVSYSFSPAGLQIEQVAQQRALESAQNFELKGAYLTLTGNTVTQAVTIASLIAQIEAVEEIVNDDEINLRLVNDEVRAGTATELDIETANNQLASDRTLLPPLRQQLNAAQHALAVLVGKSPAQFTPHNFTLDQLHLPAALPVSLPSSLVHQRPDILQAEAQFQASAASVGIANAQLYPNFSLSADLLQQVSKPQTLFDPVGNIWSVGLNLAQPVFHGGALRAAKREAEDNYKATLASYQQTVISAVGQVADILDALAHDSEQLAAEQTAFQSATSTLRLTRTSYSLGNTTLLQILDAQRLLEQARLGLARAEAQRYLDTAQLFVALGGGWWNEPAQVDASTAPPTDHDGH